MSGRWLSLLALAALVVTGCSNGSDDGPVEAAGSGDDSTWRVASQNGWEVELPPGWHQVPVRFGTASRDSSATRLAFASYDPGRATLGDVCQPGAVTAAMGADDVFVELMPDTAGNAWTREHRGGTPRVGFRGPPRECGETVVTRWSQGKRKIPVVARIWAGRDRLGGSVRDQVEATLTGLTTANLPPARPGIPPTETVPAIRIRTVDGHSDMVMMAPPYFVLYSTCGRESRGLLVEPSPEAGTTTTARIEVGGETAGTGSLLRGPVRGDLGDADEATVVVRQSSSDRGNVEATVTVEYPPGGCRVEDTDLEIRSGS